MDEALLYHHSFSFFFFDSRLLLYAKISSFDYPRAAAVADWLNA